MPSKKKKTKISCDSSVCVDDEGNIVVKLKRKSCDPKDLDKITAQLLKGKGARFMSDDADDDEEDD